MEILIIYNQIPQCFQTKWPRERESDPETTHDVLQRTVLQAGRGGRGTQRESVGI